MRTLGMTLALVLGFVGVTHGAEDMDTTLDRAVSLAEARGMSDAPKGQATDKRPATGKPNATDTAGVLVATCRDGMAYYHVTGERRGACSGHGGVEVFADGSAPKSKGRRGSYR